jgi:hypothetical protein
MKIRPKGRIFVGNAREDHSRCFGHRMPSSSGAWIRTKDLRRAFPVVLTFFVSTTGLDELLFNDHCKKSSFL